MSFRIAFVAGTASLVSILVFGCATSNNIDGNVSDAGSDRAIATPDTGTDICPIKGFATNTLTSATAPLTFRTSATGLNRCSQTEVNAFARLGSQATLANVLASLASDSCRQCALSDLNDNVWGLYVFQNTGGTDGGANRMYTDFVRPNDLTTCFAQFGSQACALYFLRRQICADNTCYLSDGQDQNCANNTQLNACHDTTFSTGGTCYEAEVKYNWVSGCTQPVFEGAVAKCNTLTSADILNYACGNGMPRSDAGAGDAGPSDAGDGGG